MSAERPVYIGTDGGATTSKVGGIWGDGTVVSTRLLQRPTNAPAGPDAVVRGWVEGITEYLAQNGLTWEQVRGVGLAIPGPYRRYGVLDRSGEALLALCAELDVAWVPFFPLGSGFPGRAKVSEHPAVIAAATTLGCTPAQAGLAWLLHHDPHILLIPGTASAAHLEENMAVAGLRLGLATAATLDTLASAAVEPPG